MHHSARCRVTPVEKNWYITWTESTQNQFWVWVKINSNMTFSLSSHSHLKNSFYPNRNYKQPATVSELTCLHTQKHKVHTHTSISLETLSQWSGSSVDFVSVGSSVRKTWLSGATCLSRVSAHWVSSGKCPSSPDLSHKSQQIADFRKLDV